MGKKIWGQVEQRVIQKDHANQSWTGAALGGFEAA
jgi:hypothetical protein